MLVVMSYIQKDFLNLEFSFVDGLIRIDANFANDDNNMIVDSCLTVEIAVEIKIALVECGEDVRCTACYFELS